MDERLVISVKECQEKMCLSKNSVYEAVRSGILPAIRVGRRILIPKAALERMLNECGQPRAEA